MKRYLGGALLIGKPRCNCTLTRRLLVAILSLVTAGLFSRCGGTVNGVGPRPNVTLSVQSLSFNSQINPLQSVMLRNSGNGVLNISSITISPHFSEHDSCTPTVAPGASCDIGVAFAPSTTGNFTGTLSISDNAPGSLQTVSLSGVGAIGNKTLTGMCFGIKRGPACGLSTFASDTTQCSVGRAAITPVDLEMCSGNDVLVDYSTVCQFTDGTGNLLQGNCEAQ